MPWLFVQHSEDHTFWRYVFSISIFIIGLAKDVTRMVVVKVIALEEPENQLRVSIQNRALINSNRANINWEECILRCQCYSHCSQRSMILHDPLQHPYMAHISNLDEKP